MTASNLADFLSDSFSDCFFPDVPENLDEALEIIRDQQSATPRCKAGGL
jgi:hypothetical protein